MNKIISYTILCFLLPALTKSQVTSLFVYDVSANIEYIRTDTMATPPTEIRVSTFFKLNYPDSVSKVVVMLGIEKDSSNVLMQEYDVVKQGNTNGLMMNNVFQKIWKHSGVCTYVFPKATMDNIRWLTLYARDKNNVVTQRKYFNIH